MRANIFSSPSVLLFKRAVVFHGVGHCSSHFSLTGVNHKCRFLPLFECNVTPRHRLQAGIAVNSLRAVMMA